MHHMAHANAARPHRHTDRCHLQFLSVHCPLPSIWSSLFSKLGEGEFLVFSWNEISFGCTACTFDIMTIDF